MKSFFTIIFLFVLSNTLFAQKDTMKVNLSDVVVTATKTKTQLSNLSSSVSLITQKQIEQNADGSVLDLIRNLEGISIVQQGGLGTLSSFFIRGANANHSLVLIDGVEVNDPSSPSNAFDLSQLQTDDIEKIEIVRGPQSTLYGSDALAGVINIFTKRGTDQNKLNISTEAGSHNFFRGSGEISGSYKIFDYSLNFSRLQTEGISAADSKFGNTEPDAYKNNSLSSTLGIQLLDNIKLNILYRFLNSNTNLDQNAKLGDDPNYSYKIEENIFRSFVNIDLFDGKWQQKFGGSLLRRISKTNDLTDKSHPNTSSHNYANAARIKFEWQNNLQLIDNNTTTVGLETEEEKANTRYISQSEWGPFESVFPSKKLRTNSIYLQNQFINNGFTALAGVRYDNNQNFGNATTYKIGTSYFIDATRTKLNANYGTGFKAPSLYYLFDPAFGNPNLKPEKNIGWDVGFEQFFYSSGLSFGITYFSMDFKNMFGYDKNFVTINVAKAKTDGIESFISYVKKNFSFYASYTFTQAKDKSDGETYNSTLIRRPKNKASLSISYNINNKFNINSTILYVGKRKDEDFSTYPSTRITLPDYTLVDIGTSYKLFNKLTLFAKVKNLFNKDYEEVLYYGSLRRTFYGGLRYGFNF